MSAPAGLAVDAILVTFNRTEELVASCRAALDQSVALRTLVVVDNSPTPTAAAALAELIESSDRPPTRIEVLHPGANLGPPGAHDVGFAYLREEIGGLEWVLLLDDDDPLPATTVVEGLLDAVPADDGDRLGGVALMGMRFVRPGLLLGGPVDLEHDGLVAADALLGWAAPLYRATALEGAGGFRPALFWGDDDIELGLRLRRAGWRLVVAADAFRALDAMSDKVPGRPRLGIVPPAPRDYYSLRNRIYIGRQYFPARSVAGAIVVRAFLKPAANLPLHPVLAARTVRLNARAVADGLRGRLGNTMELRGETRQERGGEVSGARERIRSVLRSDDGPVGRIGRWLRRTVWHRGRVPNRRPSLFRLLPPESVGAEVGVHRGDLSALIVKHLRPRRLHLIDPWRYATSDRYKDTWHGGDVGGDQRNMDRRYRGVLARFRRPIKKGVVVVHRGASVAMAAEIADGSLDWVYIDGDHAYEAVVADIAAYVPKVRPGGVIAGDDYGGTTGLRVGVKPAVDEFVQAEDVQVLQLSIDDGQWAVRLPE